MISLAERKQALTASRSLSELLPWAVLLTPGVVLCKDGSLLAGFAYRGMDTEGRGEDAKAADAKMLERAVNSFGSRRIMMWWTVRRDRIGGWSGGQFSDPIAARIDQAARRAWDSQTHYINHRMVWILVAPPTPAETLVSRIMQHGASGVPGALLPWLRATFTGSASFENDARHLLARVNEAETLFERIPTLFPDAGFSRLFDRRLLGWLNALASPANPYHPVHVRAGIESLDTVLGENALDQSATAMRMSGGAGERYVGVLSIKNLPESWPEETWPGILDGVIDAADAECVFSLGVRFLDPQEARAFVKQRRQHMLNWRKGMSGYIKESLMNVQTDAVDSEMDVYAQQAGQALEDLARTSVAGHVNPTFYVRAATPQAMERALADASRALHVAGFQTLRERIHQISAWAGTLPGQWALPVRWVYASGASIADFAPIRGASSGSTSNRHLSKMLGSKQPPLATFPTLGREPYWLEHHLRDVGNGVIIGPIGTGKSVLGGWMALRFTQYPKSRVIIFDKDRSLYKLVLGCSGQYLGETGTIKINPFQGLASDEDWSWVKGFVADLLRPENGVLEQADINAVNTACQRLRSLDPTDQRLRSLTALLPARLSEKLSPWIGDGRYAGYFDYADDAMNLSALTGIAMDEVLRHRQAARAFMDLAFFRISRLLDGSPVYIHIEEAWFLIGGPQFEAKLDDWLRTLRKLNGTVVLSTQAVSELAASKSFPVIASIPNRFLLPNPDIRTQAEGYKAALGLNDEQIDIVAGAKPKGEVVLVREGTTRVLDVRIPPEGLALLRADAEANDVFARWRNSGADDWRIRYVEELSKG
ncbi:VirB4 family type IV secretion system protein [Acidihalobacter ferrooxydans]|uniref:Uncharacterized protein n=1 Tax=Acidihalobacter ferrooxydans TaxID=1765967 RepID=A0A1P8UFB7_9GAMM|nr:hypothetical protein [Acidihalobacter ferrooxydans]APZ42543.1 hypothetical protein BW247_05085 [Acidihalobacter ferrooxydans]